MASSGSPWTERFVEMLQDGPVEKESAIASLIGLVPPGQAWRTYERTYRVNHVKRTGEEPGPLTPNEDGIRTGARQMVVQSFNSLKQRGRVEQYTDGERVKFRYLRDRIVLRGESASERSRRAALALTTEQRSERARQAALVRTPEQRSASGKAGWESLSEEEREVRIQRSREINAARDPADWSRRIRNGIHKRTPEELSEIGRQRWKQISPEERARRAQKGVETRRRRAWFRQGSEGQDDTIPSGTTRGVQPDQQGREGRAAPHHEDAVG